MFSGTVVSMTSTSAASIPRLTAASRSPYSLSLNGSGLRAGVVVSVPIAESPLRSRSR